MLTKRKNSLYTLYYYGMKHFLKRQSSGLNIQCKQIRYYCSPAKDFNISQVTFEELIKQRRLEARRSFVVQVFSEQSCWELFDYCNGISSVKYMQHFTFGCNDHFVIGELFEENIDKLLVTCRYVGEPEILPVKSPFLWFKTVEERQKKKKLKRNDPFPSYKPFDEGEIFKMMSTRSISDQMKIFYEHTRLDDIGIRLRFLVARQLEMALSGLFPSCAVLPFGSSVNGFGKIGCDLDLGLRYAPSGPIKDSRLVYQNKELGQSGRAFMQRQMEILADMLHMYFPGCSNVRRILKARVPIVKYSHDYTGLECDLSLTDLTGVYMSELLWLYGTIDSRVRPLVFTIRKWAFSVGLTSLTPGKSISNFSLSVLVLFYLQKVNIVPSFNRLVKLASPEDTRFAGDVNCSFVRNYSLIPVNTCTDDLEKLLLNFFDFFSNFDYERFGICIRSGSSISKPDHSPLYMVNPIEPSLNVSRNVSPEELTRLKVECRNALWLLQSSSSILNVFKPLHTNPQKASLKTGKRMVTVKHLFKSQNVS